MTPSIYTLCSPVFSFSRSEIGLSFGHGESVWAPTTMKPEVVGLKAPPTANAWRVENDVNSVVHEAWWAVGGGRWAGGQVGGGCVSSERSCRA